MKKIISSIFSISLLLVLFTACDEEVEIWESSTAELDGNWFVQYDHSEMGVDPFGAGLTAIHTFNTAANNGQEIWITDEDHFWSYKVRVPANPENLTFGSDEDLVNQVEDYDINIKVQNGKIIPNAATLPSGVTVDSIYFEITFEDMLPYLQSLGLDVTTGTMLVSGARQSGFLEDPH